jgi:hypothetical protein
MDARFLVLAPSLDDPQVSFSCNPINGSSYGFDYCKAKVGDGSEQVARAHHKFVCVCMLKFFIGHNVRSTLSGAHSSGIRIVKLPFCATGVAKPTYCRLCNLG